MKRAYKNIDQKLLALYLLDEISQQGRSTVEAWLNESKENRKHFADLEKIWNATGKIDPESVVFDTERAWERLKIRIGEEQRDGEKQKIGEEVIGPSSHTSSGLPSSRLLSYSVMAAAAVLVIGIFSVVFFRMNQNRQDNRFTTLAAAGAVVHDTLIDGSTIVLNTNSSLRVSRKFTRTNRNVEL